MSKLKPSRCVINCARSLVAASRSVSTPRNTNVRLRMYKAGIVARTISLAILDHPPGTTLRLGAMDHVVRHRARAGRANDLIRPKAGGIREHLTYLRFEWSPQDIRILNPVPQNGIFNHMLRNVILNLSQMI
jgi:hypothetical protein